MWCGSNLCRTCSPLLSQNIRRLSRQRAFQRLLSDADGREYDFHVASNRGASSSLLEPAAHQEMFPGVRFTEVIKIASTTLDRLVVAEKLDLARYQALVMDTQGAELMVLKGAEETLRSLRFIKAEGCDFESYAGCCTVDQIAAYLATQGFREHSRRPFKTKPGLGTYFDVLYVRDGA